ncbi:MAG TPA: hypothetical protein VF718_05880 [Allosphingosinicella sp.]|jgi:hypothetical protein
MNPFYKISEMIADLEGTRPKPFRVHMRRLRILIEIIYRRLAWYIVGSLAMSGAAMLLLGMFALDNQAVPLLGGLFKMGIAVALGWEQMQFDLGEPPMSPFRLGPRIVRRRRLRRDEGLDLQLGQGGVDWGHEDGGEAGGGHQAYAGAEF